MKICRKCLKELSEICFYRNRNFKDGRYSCCKECIKIDRQKYSEARRKYMQTYNKKNKAHLYIVKRDWGIRNAEKNKERLKKWYQANKERIKEKSKKYYKLKKEHIKARISEWKKGSGKDVVIKWRIKNKENIKAKRKIYREKNRIKFSIYQNKRRANGQVNLSEVEILNMLKNQNRRCVYCGKKLEKFHIDHILPISKGGSNDLSNIQITCPSCNLKKYNKTDTEFRTYFNEN